MAMLTNLDLMRRVPLFARLTVAQPAPVRPRTPTHSGLRMCCTSRANRGSSAAVATSSSAAR